MIDEQLDHSGPAAPASMVRRRGIRGNFWRELPILLVIALLVAITVRMFVLQTFFIPSPSMEHTLDVNDRVMVNKLVYDFHKPARGDVIVFVSPMSWRNTPDETDFIKRVIGVGGDHVTCCDAQGRITVNGVPLDETYLNNAAGKLPASPNFFSIVVPQGRLWVMGDNRFYSGDSQERYYVTDNLRESTIPTSAVIGRAFAIFWPFGRATWLRTPPTFEQVKAVQPG